MAKHCSRLNSLHIEHPECAASASPWLRPFNMDEETVQMGVPPSHAKAMMMLRKSRHDDVDFRNLLEPLFERRRRYISLGIVTFAAFIYNFTLSAILIGTKPYLDQVDPKAGTQFLGLTQFAIYIAQFVFSPFIGFLSDKVGSVRVLSIILTLLLSGGYVLYATIPALPEPRRWYLLAARFLIGAASGSIAIFYSYIASATTIRERTTAFSYFSFAGSTAVFLGPVVQLAFAPIGHGAEIPMGFNLFFNTYSGPLWLSAGLAVITAIAFLPFCFTEYHIAKRESDLLAQRAQTRKCRTCMTLCNSPQSSRRLSKPDKWALIVCIIIFFSVQFCFVFLESLATSLAVEQLGLNESLAATTVAVAFAAAAIFSGFIYAIIGPLARRLSERAILTVGIVLLILGPLCMNPFPGPLPPFEIPSNDSYIIPEEQAIELGMSPVGGQLDGSGYIWDAVIALELPLAKLTLDISNGVQGCPIDRQAWCGTTPAIRREQLVIGFLLIVAGFSIGVSMTTSIFSKIVGAFPEGAWMGFLGAGACVARVLCPICVTAVYPVYGPWATFGFMCTLMIATLFLLLVNYKRLLPYSYDEKVAAHEDESNLVPYALRPSHVQP